MNQQSVTLVLGGGGSKGSYEVGACKALLECGYRFDAIIGASIGSLCGAILVQQDLAALERWIKTFTQKELSNDLFIFPQLYDHPDLVNQDIDAFLDPLCQDGPDIRAFRQSYEKIFDFQTFKQSKIDFACMTYNISRKEPKVFFKSDFDENSALDILFASAAYFPAFDLVKIGKDWYADGAYANAVPFELVNRFKAQKSIVIDISGFYQKDPLISNSDQLLIRPMFKLHYFLDFTAKDLIPQMQEGYLETLKYLNEAPGYLYTFYKEDWDMIVQFEQKYMEMLVEAQALDVLEHFDTTMEAMYGFFFGYSPRPLENQYSSKYVLGRMVEMIGIICNISMSERYHFNEFIKLVLQGLEHFDQDPNVLPYPLEYKAMEVKSVRNMIVFFHSLFLSYQEKLPPQFEIFQKKFPFPYAIARVWRLLESIPKDQVS